MTKVKDAFIVGDYVDVKLLEDILDFRKKERKDDRV